MEKKEACGLFGITNHAEAVHLTTLGLFALQHRGEEAAGIAYCVDKRIHLKSGLGKVNEVFANNDYKKEFQNSYQAIGHTRYSITGGLSVKNIQPLVVRHLKGEFSIAHNGNLINAKELREKLERQGSVFQTTMDSEIFVHLIANSKAQNFEDAIAESVRQVRGSYSLLIMTSDTIYGVRDPNGFRPLCLGKLDDSLIITSETCALDLLNAKYMGQVHAGQMVVLKKNESRVKKIFSKPNLSRCIFEMIYFSRPDSLIFGNSVYQFRKKTGKVLAQEAPVEADFVVPIPDSGNHAAIGYAEELKLPIEFAITKNHYFGRSFIQPEQSERDFYVKLKLNPIKNLINKKRIVLIDDSIVRGTTTKKKIKALKSVGAKEVHLRIASPPITHPCYFGIDFPDKSKLIANKMDLKEIKNYLELDSLAYISLQGLESAGNDLSYCKACFSGEYPLKIDGDQKKENLELF